MKIAVLGVGNILFKDEGFGVFIVKFLEKNYKFYPEISLIDGGTGGFKLIEYFQDYDYIFLIDVISLNDKPGSIYKIPGDKLAGISSYHQTAHEVEVLQMIDLAALGEKSAKVEVIGIIPEDITTTQIGLTKTLEDSFPMVVSLLLKELENIGIKYEKIDNRDLKDVVIEFIGSYNNIRSY
ncbi:HyaD/HybD family hydrogenase maturation endopeptidase [Sulfurihydrogenibium sp.]|uniref:HyaD/HybD family hydrogenase maturation endopeptidase n=1 Tax=Sulfurihydrogenibium sp. TaxID=2053621 RepID=UPI002621241A|nr:HyaD/HybD family hydrogenase maturation endopeptidase [Sulfurihydrogenibium sp.]